MLLGARAAQTRSALDDANARITSFCVELARKLNAKAIAAYLPVSTEPAGSTLADALLDAGFQVILPICAPKRLLKWATYSGPESVAPAKFGLLEPTAEPLPGHPLNACDLILVPAVAATPDGYRMGKGGGFYDIALSDVDHPVPTAVVVYSNEVRADTPIEPHDARCDYIITENGFVST